ncbi:MAG: hypothetical protein V1743_04320 [Nanoarchaeota archaeon]
MISKVVLADERLAGALEKLKYSTTEDKQLYDSIQKVFDRLKENAFSGIQIPKRLIPKEYIQKYRIDNLWKHNLPKGWRLLYSITSKEVLLISIIIEWVDHKKYEKRFKY